MSTLPELIALHRDLYADDLHIDRLVSRQPPTALDRHTGELQEEPAAATGMSMSGRLLKYLGHPEGYGESHPWSKAWWLLKVECRRKHPHHRTVERPYWRGALCWQAVKLTVIGGEAKGSGPLTVEQAAQVLQIDRIEELLRGAFRDLQRFMDEERERRIQRERQEASHAEVVNAPKSPRTPHGMGGIHMRECPQCRRNAA